MLAITIGFTLECVTQVNIAFKFTKLELWFPSHEPRQQVREASPGSRCAGSVGYRFLHYIILKLFKCNLERYLKSVRLFIHGESFRSQLKLWLGPGWQRPWLEQARAERPLAVCAPQQLSNRATRCKCSAGQIRRHRFSVPISGRAGILVSPNVCNEIRVFKWFQCWIDRSM